MTKTFLIFLQVAAVGCLSMAMSNASPSPTPGHMPRFSWDTVPMFYHAGKWAGPYSDEEVKMLAGKYPLVVIEKMHGQNDPRFEGQVEKAVFLDAKRIKQANPDTKVLFYFNPFVDYRYYSWKTSLPEVPSWALRGPDGQVLCKDRGVVKFVQFDITHPQFMPWWLDKVRLVAEKPQIDGIFIDALPQIVRWPGQKYETWGRSKYLDMRWACHGFLRETRDALNGKILINNGLFADVDGLFDGGLSWLDNADGAMVEHFGAFASRDEQGTLRAEKMAREIELIEIAADRGTIVVVKAWPGDMHFLSEKHKKFSMQQKLDFAEKKLEFALAAFLIAAQENCYFGYSWGWSHSDGWMQWYPEFDKPLGPPQGRAKRDGWKYTRNFRHASVKLDLDKETGEITWTK